MAELWPRVSRLGEETWLVEFEPRLDEEINQRVLQLAADIGAARIPGVRDIVPAVASLAVHTDGDGVDERALEDWLSRLAAKSPIDAVPPVRHEIPACYEAPYGPDLAEVASLCRCREQDVIEWHAARDYRVFMIGFLPGFPYLGLLDSRLALPRRVTPRLAVPAGSIGVAGRQTGIYPSTSPGGWHIIGRTPLALFNPEWHPPARLSAGDRVHFVPIGAREFASVSAEAGGTRS